MFSKKNWLQIMGVSLVVLLAGCKGCMVQGTGKNYATDIDISRFLASDHKENIYIPIAIIGSGPAGTAAALHASRSLLVTVVFQGNLPGGLLTQTSDVENWAGVEKASGMTIMDKDRKQAEEFGALFADDVITDIDVNAWPFKLQTESGATYYALSVIIASGATPILLDVPGEKQYFGSGVGTCALCDAPFFKQKEVVIVGGGDSAVEEAMQMSAYAKKVTMLVRKDKMRAAEASQKMLKDYPSITILYNTQVKEVKGDGKKVTGVVLLNNKTNETTDFPLDGVFIAIGHEPNTALFKGKINLDDKGYVLLQDIQEAGSNSVMRTQATSVSGIFAAGDCHDHRYRQANTASGYGTAAGIDAINFLKERGFNSQIQPVLIDHIYKK